MLCIYIYIYACFCVLFVCCQHCRSSGLQPIWPLELLRTAHRRWVSSLKSFSSWGPNPQEDVPWRLWLRLRWRHLGWTAANDPRWMVNLYDLNGEPKGTWVIAGSVALRIWDPKKWGNYRFHYEQDALFLFVIPLGPVGSDIIFLFTVCKVWNFMLNVMGSESYHTELLSFQGLSICFWKNKIKHVFDKWMLSDI